MTDPTPANTHTTSPLSIGDKGQRFEIKALPHKSTSPITIGYTADPGGGSLLMSAWRVYAKVWVVDRKPKLGGVWERAA